jgi:ABC-2 type transport system ATP-binding protein
MLPEPREARQELSALLLALRGGGMTIIVSSHILAELEDYSTHMLILRDGRIAEHCPIRAAAGPQRRLVVTLSAPVPALAEHLRGLDNVGAVTPLDGGAAFDFTGDADGQHRLLRALIEAGLPVCALAEERRSMQDVYLARLRS